MVGDRPVSAILLRLGLKIKGIHGPGRAHRMGKGSGSLSGKKGCRSRAREAASLKEVQEILGHKSVAVTRRYARLSQEHKKKTVNLLNGLTASPRTPTDLTCHKPITFSDSQVSATG